MYDLLNSPKFRNFDQRLNTPHIMSPSRFATAAVGGWKELGRTTLGTAGTVIDVSSIPDRRYYMILCVVPSAVTNNSSEKLTFNADTGTTYAFRRTANGGADAAGASQTEMLTSSLRAALGGTFETFSVGYVSNIVNKEKLAIVYNAYVGIAAAATTAPDRQQWNCKWVGTAVIDQMTITSTSANFAIGSELVILGWDPEDTHTTNFWEELASVTAGGASTNLSSGTIAAKKYLWVQAYTESNSAHVSNMTFNNDTTTYSYRTADDGAADATGTSAVLIPINQSTSTGVFTNMFIINNSANEKLVIGHSVLQSTAGATTAPNRREFIGKWVETASQITEIDIDSSSGNYTTSSIIKVWGAD